jgi:SPP1 gp7 family putative phage head morphogenesis protein
MAVTAKTLRLQTALRRELRKITDAHTRALVSAWADAWDEISPDLTKTLLDMLTAGDQVTTADLMRSTRLRQALRVIASHLGELSRQSQILITGDLRRVIDIAGAAQASVIDSQLPPRHDLVALEAWSRVDARQLEAIVTRSTHQITARHYPLSRQAYDAARRELIRGVAAGSNPKVTARRMVQRVEGRFNGGLNRALVIARTETLDAHRAGGALGMSQHADVLRGWEWLAALDERTCPSCWSQHGTIHPLDEPGPNDHPQGRCARNPLTRSWADLGFDIPEPPSVTPDAEQVFTSLSPDQQRQILGPARHAAYADGQFPMSDWSVRRENPGWRDSYQTAPALQSGGRVSRSAA